MPSVLLFQSRNRCAAFSEMLSLGDAWEHALDKRFEKILKRPRRREFEKVTCQLVSMLRIARKKTADRGQEAVNLLEGAYIQRWRPILVRHRREKFFFRVEKNRGGAIFTHEREGEVLLDFQGLHTYRSILKGRSADFLSYNGGGRWRFCIKG